ncbi:glycosyltransferase [Gemmobacter fulvus]|uniref:glycosyltransferase family 8 protein n=1 Tax=Gemmobacter fulvus TaxID=2840474 RepID=UPI002796BE90|nr:glycosyltransferase [Gemmobacter fulvus]MDQ1848262.1 glycosyltransferase [Gemmobacter fulvus]
MMAPDVTLVFDRGFLRPSLIAAYSVLKHRPKDVTLRFLVTEPVPDLIPALTRLRAAFPGAEILSQQVDVPPLEVGGHVSPATLARLALPRLLERPTLYIDGDTMIRRDIGPVFATDLKGLPVAACLDTGIRKALWHRKRGSRLISRKSARHLADLDKIAGLVDPETYINAGVFLFDLPRIRALGLDVPMGDAAGAVALRKQYGLRFNDQNWLNKVFKRQIAPLDPIWNALWGNRATGRSPFPPEEQARFAESRRDPGLVHFTGRLRPWDIRYPIFYPKRRPWLAEYKVLQAEAEPVLGL